MKKRILGLGPNGQLVTESRVGRALPGSPTAHTVRRSAFLLLDRSSSMAGQKLSQARAGAEDFARTAISKGYLVGLVVFSSEAVLACSPDRSIEPIVSRLDVLAADGGTNMTAALELATGHLRELSGERAIVLVTDGAPDDRNSALAVGRQAARLGIRVITIGTDDADIGFLRELSSDADLANKVDAAQLRQGIAAAARRLTSGTPPQ